MTTGPNRVISFDCLYIPRQEADFIPLDDRMGKNEVEKTLSTEAAMNEGLRCVHCFVNTIFDSDKCILCGGCVDVCPESCLELTSLARIEPSDEMTGLIEKRFGVSQVAGHEDSYGDINAMAIIKDETFCIRCGLCAERCPTNTITMEKFEPVLK